MRVYATRHIPGRRGHVPGDSPMKAHSMKAHSLMVLGTASSVGKSTIVAALCRIFANMDIDVAPFKAQNMSLNSAPTLEDLEIGRAQAFQAEAARKAPSVDMNPILIKPTGDSRAQVVVEGRPWKQADAWELYREKPGLLFPFAVAAYERLAQRVELVVLEGAGSPAEINLRDGDIANLRMARAANAPCLLVGDIERGGVFASIYGTLALLEPEERRLVRGFVINKFRGEVRLLDGGIAEIERRVGIPCMGVIPWSRDFDLDEEDSCGAARSHEAWDGETRSDRRLRIAIVELPSTANATDFAALRSESAVALRWIRTADEMDGADAVIVPGSKDTIADVRWIRSAGLDDALIRHARADKPLIGICGGLQILGNRISDPHGVESGGEERGLGLLDVDTTLELHKTTTQCTGTLTTDVLFDANVETLDLSGYEIHVGSTILGPSVRPFARLVRRDGTRTEDGAVNARGNVIGTYLHGLFDGDALRHRLLDQLRAGASLEPMRVRSDFSANREARIENLAGHVSRALDVEAILGFAGIESVASV